MCEREQREREKEKPQRNAKRTDITNACAGAVQKSSNKRDHTRKKTKSQMSTSLRAGSLHHSRSHAETHNGLLIANLDNHTCSNKSACQHAHTHSHTRAAGRTDSTGATSEDAGLPPPPPSLSPGPRAPSLLRLLFIHHSSFPM